VLKQLPLLVCVIAPVVQRHEAGSGRDSPGKCLDVVVLRS
jgi:hypothetical protein